MTKPRKPNPYLTVYLGAVNAAFQLWRAAYAPVGHGIRKDVAREELRPLIAYLSHVRTSAATLTVPPGGEAVQRAMLETFDDVLAWLTEWLNGQDDSGEQHAISAMENYQILDMELERLAQKGMEPFDY